MSAPPVIDHRTVERIRECARNSLERGTIGMFEIEQPPQTGRVMIPAPLLLAIAEMIIGGRPTMNSDPSAQDLEGSVTSTRVVRLSPSVSSSASLHAQGVEFLLRDEAELSNAGGTVIDEARRL